MSKREWRLYIEDILESIGLIRSYTSHRRISGSKSRERCSRKRRIDEAGYMPYFPAFLRNSPARGRV
jgi:hypothetical protein